MKSAFVFLADGFEDVEAVTPIDYLRRADVSVTVVGVSGKIAASSHQVSITCDAFLSDILVSPLPDLAVLPGGSKGSENLASSAELKSFITTMMDERRFVGAICAAPAVVLGAWGLLDGRSFTCYPGLGEDLPTKPLKERVVVDLNLITSRSAGTAEEFSIALVKILCGTGSATKLADAILARD